MKVSVFVIAVLFSTTWCQSAEGPPEWAYGVQTPPVRAPVDSAEDQGARRLPGNSLSFTRAQIGNPFDPADWYSGDHPPMPDIVAKGRKPGIWACALCHYPNGKGRPENASVIGFTREYFVQQMYDFARGNRKTAEPRKANTARMAAFAQNMTEAEIQESANYFCSMRWTPWIKVVETDRVPKMYTSVGMFLPLPAGEKEPIGERIIETPVDPEATEVLRDPHSSFIAYAPVGSISKGEKLVTGPNEKTIQCGVCHGSDLTGMGPVPGIAGRSPSYLVRQMYDMQQGFRKGLWTELMKPIVSKLTNEDMLNIAAYVSSREPKAGLIFSTEHRSPLAR
jgi:cytochrome c553